MYEIRTEGADAIFVGSRDPEAIAIAMKLWLGGAFIAVEPCVFPRFYRDLKPTKLPSLGSTWPNIGPTWAQLGPT